MNLELQTAVKAAKAAGAITLSRFGELSQREIVTKEFKDFVTEVDKHCEATIAATIAEAFPEDGLLCEEGTSGNGASGRVWIVDPLDGTLNFIHSFPVFGISIAMRDASGELAVGVVYQPVLDELFTAVRGEGAFLNGERIGVSTRDEKGSYLFATGLPFRDYDHYIDDYIGLLRDVIADSAGIRRAGSASIDLAYTAAGRFDGFFEYRLFPWDFAAGVLLVREAGGIVTGIDGSPDVFAHTSILAGSPLTHRLLLEKAQRHFGDAV
ncbi:inositol monophosphatase [Chlorobaculum thiosulfatiphilum]|uniref:Inositol-1-monophosphatase n=1 Tax=Chlorobaculum thiosulfatiphilum TaxID=115852 RepID=A0A5C4S815_CHLTI|nr:inositol monophosphatase family protein [Chlorobaculum thiosulfatiphilum]TNJ39653.1 inositol monophosphatase [Chlorobaculum thiosulfatiphilum]